MEDVSLKLLVATQNPGKVREFRSLLAPLRAELSFPGEMGIDLYVPEDGATYLENANQKVLLYAQYTGLLTLADDSGLEVDSLDGAPGLHSARYARGSDLDRVAVLLEELREVAPDHRTARFRCVVAVASPTGQLGHSEGVCEGVIAGSPVGQGGFGYDSVFYLPERGRTMAQLDEEEKNKISHRARAIQAIMPVLRRLR